MSTTGGGDKGPVDTVSPLPELIKPGSAWADLVDESAEDELAPDLPPRELYNERSPELVRDIPDIPGPPYSLYVGNLPPRMATEEVADIFHDLKITSIRMKTNYCFVEFDSLQDAQAGLMQERRFRDRALLIRPADHTVRSVRQEPRGPADSQDWRASSNFHPEPPPSFPERGPQRRYMRPGFPDEFSGYDGDGPQRWGSQGRGPMPRDGPRMGYRDECPEGHEDGGHHRAMRVPSDPTLASRMAAGRSRWEEADRARGPPDVRGTGVGMGPRGGGLGPSRSNRGVSRWGDDEHDVWRRPAPPEPPASEPRPATSIPQEPPGDRILPVPPPPIPPDSWGPRPGSHHRPDLPPVPQPAPAGPRPEHFEGPPARPIPPPALPEGPPAPPARPGSRQSTPPVRNASPSLRPPHENGPTAPPPPGAGDRRVPPQEAHSLPPHMRPPPPGPPAPPTGYHAPPPPPMGDPRFVDVQRPPYMYAPPVEGRPPYFPGSRPVDESHPPRPMNPPTIPYPPPPWGPSRPGPPFDAHHVPPHMTPQLQPQYQRPPYPPPQWPSGPGRPAGHLGVDPRIAHEGSAPYPNPPHWPPASAGPGKRSASSGWEEVEALGITANVDLTVLKSGPPAPPAASGAPAQQEGEAPSGQEGVTQYADEDTDEVPQEGGPWQQVKAQAGGIAPPSGQGVPQQRMQILQRHHNRGPPPSGNEDRQGQGQEAPMVEAVESATASLALLQFDPNKPVHLLKRQSTEGSYKSVVGDDEEEEEEEGGDYEESTGEGDNEAQDVPVAELHGESSEARGVPEAGGHPGGPAGIPEVPPPPPGTSSQPPPPHYPPHYHPRGPDGGYTGRGRGPRGGRRHEGMEGRRGGGRGGRSRWSSGGVDGAFPVEEGGGRIGSGSGFGHGFEVPRHLDGDSIRGGRGRGRRGRGREGGRGFRGRGDGPEHGEDFQHEESIGQDVALDGVRPHPGRGPGINRHRSGGLEKEWRRVDSKPRNAQVDVNGPQRTPPGEGGSGSAVVSGPEVVPGQEAQAGELAPSSSVEVGPKIQLEGDNGRHGRRPRHVADGDRTHKVFGSEAQPGREARREKGRRRHEAEENGGEELRGPEVPSSRPRRLPGEGVLERKSSGMSQEGGGRGGRGRGGGRGHGGRGRSHRAEGGVVSHDGELGASVRREAGARDASSRTSSQIAVENALGGLVDHSRSARQDSSRKQPTARKVEAAAAAAVAAPPSQPPAPPAAPAPAKGPTRGQQLYNEKVLKTQYKGATTQNLFDLLLEDDM